MVQGKLLERRKFPRTPTNGTLPGRLLIDETNQEVICRSSDVSRMGLGIESSANIPMNTVLALEFLDRKVKLRLVASLRLTADTHAITRYGLLLLDTTADLEAEFRAAGCIEDNEKPLRRRIEKKKGRDDRAPRFQLTQEIHVKIQTFGSRDPYLIGIENLSRSGLLIAISTDKEIPFKLNTLVDLEIDPESRVFTKPIHATGKVVRRMDEPSKDSPAPSSKMIRLGIAVGEINPTDEKHWQEALDELELNAKATQIY